MSRLFITGDTHGDFKRLSYKNWPESRDLKEGDCLIVTGDFGLLWNHTTKSMQDWWTWWFDERPFKVLFVPGNHENWDEIERLPQVSMFDGFVGQVSKNIFCLNKINALNICNYKVLVVGGAESIDKASRMEGSTWWRQEIPTVKECNDALDLIDLHGKKFDLVLTHTAPLSVIEAMNIPVLDYINDPTSKFLEVVLESVDFKRWYFGHFHDNIRLTGTFYDKHQMLFDKITEVTI
jgi:predicted MPP superfamily phosphohydrolase